MDNYSNAWMRIKSLECPTSDLQERIQEILADYDIADESDILIARAKNYDREGLQAYKIDLVNHSGSAKIILTKSGTEDYVVKVFDVLDE